jgi:hypothetical protein
VYGHKGKNPHGHNKQNFSHYRLLLKFPMGFLIIAAILDL